MLRLHRSTYELGEALRVGALTQTFRVAQRGAHEHAPLLLKQLLPQLAGDAATAERWLALAAENERFAQPSLAHVVDHGETPAGVFLVVEELDAVSLQRLVGAARASGSPLSVDAACQVALSVLEALAPAHARTPPRAHLDLSPTSVLVRPDGSVVLTELGLWAALPPALASRQRLDRGRVAHGAPELTRGLPGDVRSDVFSLGVLLFELLAGHHPFAGENPMQIAMALAEGRRTPSKQAVPALPDGLCDVLDAMLAPSPEERFQSARAALTALQTVGPLRASGHAALRALALRAAEPSPAPAPRSTPVASPALGGTQRFMSPPMPALGTSLGAAPARPLSHPPVLAQAPARASEPPPPRPSLVPPPLLTHASGYPTYGLAPTAPAPAYALPVDDGSQPAPASGSFPASSRASAPSHPAPASPPPAHAAPAPYADLRTAWHVPEPARSGRTTFLNRRVAPAALTDPAPVAGSAPGAQLAAPPLVSPSQAPGLHEPMPALAPPASPSPFLSVPPAPPPVLSEGLPSLARAGGADRPWREPSPTLFGERVARVAPSVRAEPRVPPLLLIGLSVLLGFTLCLGLYFLARWIWS